MLDDLFISDATNPASMGDIELSQDKDSWPQEIQAHVIESVPMLSQIPGNLTVDMFDEDKGYIKGSYIVPIPSQDPNSNAPEEAITIPILVKGGRMFPPDVYIYRGQFKPIDEEEMGMIFANPSLGEELIEEEDIPDTAYEGFANQITPPGTYGSGAVHVIKSGSVNHRILHELKNDPTLLCKIGAKRTFRKLLGSFLDKDEFSIKKASLDFPLAKGNEVITFLGNGRYRIKAAALIDSKVMERQHTVDQRTFNTWAKLSGINAKRIYNDLKSKKMSYSWSSKDPTKVAVNKKISSPGTYKVYDSCGKAKTASVVGRVKIGSFGQEQTYWLALDNKKNFAFQDGIFGKPAKSIKTSGLKEKPGVTDVFTFKTSPGYYAEPMKIASITAFNSEEVGRGITIKARGIASGEPVSCIMLKEAGINRAIKVKHIPEGVFAEKTAEAWMMPVNYNVIKLGKEIKLASSGNDLINSRQAMGDSSMAKLSFLHQKDGRVSLKVNGGETQTISAMGALSLLKQAGINEPLMALLPISNINSEMVGKEVYEKVAMKFRPEPLEDVYMTNLPLPKVAKYVGKNFPAINPITLVKVASEMDNEEAMSDVLSIAYADPTNLAVYKEHLPSLKETEEVLSRLLITARLGQQALDEKDIRSALFQLHGVIKSLETEIQ